MDPQLQQVVLTVRRAYDGSGFRFISGFLCVRFPALPPGVIRVPNLSARTLLPFFPGYAEKDCGKENMFIDSKIFLETHESPSFEQFTLQDINPVSGNVKTRKISNPNPSMREIHRRIIQAVQDLDLWNFHSFESPYSNASKHIGSRYFYQTDLKDAYGSVSLEKLVEIIVSLRPEWKQDDVREILTSYCFEKSGGLIVGAPASPKLFNIYANHKIDRPLLKLWPYMRDDMGQILRKYYTRYIDDLTFSSLDPISGNTRRMIRGVIEEAGFKINHRKSNVLDLVKGPIVITGVGLEWRPHRSARLFLPRHYLKRMFGLLHLTLKGDPRVSHSQVEGLMGVFHGVFGRKYEHSNGIVQFTATEEKFLRMYWTYRSRYSMRR